jgi:hypothetical protein
VTKGVFFIPTEEPGETEGPSDGSKKGVVRKVRKLKPGASLGGSLLQPKPDTAPAPPKSMIPPLPSMDNKPVVPPNPLDEVYNNIVTRIDVLGVELKGLEETLKNTDFKDEGASAGIHTAMEAYLVRLRKLGIETEFHLAKNDFPSTEMARLDSKYKDLKKGTAKVYNTIYEPPEDKTRCGLCDAYVFTEYCEVCDRPTGKTALVDLIKGLENAAEKGTEEEEVFEELEPVEEEKDVQPKKGYMIIADIKDAGLLFDGKEVKKGERLIEGFRYTPRGVVDVPADGRFYWEIYARKPDGSIDSKPTVLIGKAEALPDNKGTLVTAEGTFSLNKDEMPIAQIVYMEKGE